MGIELQREGLAKKFTGRIGGTTGLKRTRRQINTDVIKQERITQEPQETSLTKLRNYRTETGI